MTTAIPIKIAPKKPPVHVTHEPENQRRPESLDSPGCWRPTAPRHVRRRGVANVTAWAITTALFLGLTRVAAIQSGTLGQAVRRLLHLARP